MMKILWMVCVGVMLASGAAALEWVYSETPPETMPLQGGILVPVDVAQVTVDMDGVTRQQYRFHLLKFDDAPDATRIDQYKAAGVDVQRGSHKHPDWLKRLTETRIKDAVAPLVQGRILKASLTAAEWTGIISGYPDWVPSITLAPGAVVRFKGDLYRVVQGHTTQADWEPDATPALFSVSTPPIVIADWVQPTGAHDAYQIGDRVRFEAAVYESLIKANVWSPAVYQAGWKKL